VDLFCSFIRVRCTGQESAILFLSSYTVDFASFTGRPMDIALEILRWPDISIRIEIYRLHTYLSFRLEADL
jgi:hypothetical protein